MSCSCGYVIVDQTDELVYKASFISDLDSFSLSDAIKNQIDSAQDIDIEENKIKLYDEIISQMIKYSQDLYECTQCGRLWVDIKNNCFQAFQSESGRYEAVLKVKHK